MDKRTIGTGIFLGVLGAILTLVVFSLADSIFGFPLLPFDVLDWMTRNLPGGLITFGIDTMVDTLIAIGFDVSRAAKPAEQAMSFLMLGSILIVIGTGFVVATLKTEPEAPSSALGAAMGVVVGILSGALVSMTVRYTIFEFLWVVGVITAWGAWLGWAVDNLFAISQKPTAVEQVDRRQFLVRAGGATAAFTVVGTGLSVALGSNSSRRIADITSLPSSSDDSDFVLATIKGEPVQIPNLNARVEAVSGTRPEYTPLDSHYQIDINTRPPILREDEWRLSIRGLVDNEVELTLNDIVTTWEPREEFVTLSCISNRIAGSLISTTLWTGVSLRDILGSVGVKRSAQWLFIESADGFFESVNLDMVMEDERIMLAYAWNREPLRIKHGFPLRIWIPDRYGMKQPKWIESITVTDTYEKGYWVKRTWDEDAIVQPVSVIDTIDVHMEGEEDVTTVPMGGIAYSGAKGISQVQVRVDDGEWADAELRVPISDYTWVIWRYEWPFEEGEHTIAVRAYTGDGELQPTEVTDVRPDGATGIHSVTQEF